MRKFYLFIIVLLFCTCLQAKEVISFVNSTSTLHKTAYVVLRITEGKEYTIDWGDGSEIKTYTGKGDLNSQHLYIYPEINSKYTTIIQGVTDDAKIFYLDIGNKYYNCTDVSSMDLSSALSLERIGTPGYIKIDSLDVSMLSKLTAVYLSDSDIEYFRGSSSIQYLDLFYGKLKTINLSEMTSLRTLIVSGNPLGELDLTNNIELYSLQCGSCSLSYLDISKNTKLNTSLCLNNMLTLTNLYEISKQVGPGEDLFPQKHQEKSVSPGYTIDFSDELFFGDPAVETTFSIVKEDNEDAVLGTDYRLEQGKLTFLLEGKYTLTMANSAIKAYETDQEEAGVIIPFDVILGAGNSDVLAVDFSVYPNPTKGKISIKGNEIVYPVFFFDLQGRLLEQFYENEIDLSSYVPGYYLLKINNKTVKVIKE